MTPAKRPSVPERCSLPNCWRSWKAIKLVLITASVLTAASVGMAAFRTYPRLRSRGRRLGHFDELDELEMRRQDEDDASLTEGNRRHGLPERPASRRHRLRQCLVRSEEHTSELQRLHLVCRLLLEKKKTNNVC